MISSKGIPTLKSWHFEANKDIFTKFKSQGLYIKGIKYWNASGSGSTPFLIPTYWNIGILLHKQAKSRTIMHTTVFSNYLHAHDLKVSFGSVFRWWVQARSRGKNDVLFFFTFLAHLCSDNYKQWSYLDYVVLLYIAYFRAKNIVIYFFYQV